MYVYQLALPQTNISFINYPDRFEKKNTRGHYCPTGWVSNSDHKYLAVAFSTLSFIQCNIVYNNAIESLFIWHLSYFGRILSLVDPKYDWRGILCVFYFKLFFCNCAIFAISKNYLWHPSSNKLIYYYVVWIYKKYINIDMFRYRVILFGRSRVSIHHIDLWRKKCHRWHLTDECFFYLTPESSHVCRQWLAPSRKCQENPKAVTPSGNDQRGVGRMSHLMNGITFEFLVHIIFLP